MTVVTIREATHDDAPRIAVIVIASWRHAYRGVLPDAALDRDTHDDRVVRIRRRMDENWPTYIAGDIGMARLALVPRRGDAELEGLYVHPDGARKGVGRALVRHVATQLYGALYLSALRDNVIGRAFYDKLGGRIVEEGTWTYDGIAYPTVGYLWDDVASLR
jgi:ribosomal protein S18 acetylase RimI-like enzyme